MICRIFSRCAQPWLKGFCSRMGGYNLPPNRIGGIRDIGSFVVGPSHSGVVHDCLDSALDTAELNKKLMMVFLMQNGISYCFLLIFATLDSFMSTSRPNW